MVHLNPKYYSRTAIGIAILTIVTIIIRFFALHMYDLHIDEITYAQFAKTIDAGQLPRDYDGKPFFLHPPGYFALLAIWRAIFWHGNNIFQEFITLRTLNVVLAGATLPFLTLITKRLTKSDWLALLAGTLFAIDPFVIRQNTRSLMETATMLFLLIGTWLLLQNVKKPITNKYLWLSVGFVFGLAMITKDVAINFTVLMFALMAICKVGPGKKVFHYLIPAAAFPYSAWLAIVTFSGYAGPFFYQKTLGIRRFFGLIQTTGFNSSTSPSKGGTIMQTIPHYATSYGILGLGAAASCLLLFSKDTERKRWGCVGMAATILLGYLFVGGTFEEQYLYYLMVPSIISVIVGVVELINILPKKLHKTIDALASLIFIVAICFGIVSYAINAPKTSKGWQDTIDWVDNNIPANSEVCTFGQGQFLLGGHGFDVCDYKAMAQIRNNHVQYIIVSEKLTYSNYEPISAATYEQIKKSSVVVFSTYSPDAGEFKVVKMDNPGTPSYLAPPVSKNIAKTPKTKSQDSKSSTTTPTALANLPSQPSTLPNTGISITSSVRLFVAASSVGVACSYAFRYLKSRIEMLLAAGELS